MKITNTFLGGKMNMDIDQRLLPKGQYFKALNIEVINSENESSNLAYGDSGTLRNSLGNKQPVNGAGGSLNVTNISGAALVAPRCIGACINPQSNSIYWLITSTYEDLIVEYLDTPNVTPTGGAAGTAGAISYIARAVKPTATGSGKYFNFNINYPVTGMNYFNGFLMWTDNLNPPRMINVNTFKTWTTPAVNFAWNQDDINVIVKPPLTAPTVELTGIGVEGNYISEKFIYFSYRYKYTDGRWSSIAPFSKVAFKPSVFSYNAYTGYNAGMLNTISSVFITVATGDRQVTDIQFLFKDSSQPNVYIIETINKAKPIISTSIIPDNSLWTYKKFDNTKTYSSLPSSQLTRLFDNVPTRALGQDIIGSRLIYGNYTQYYNMITTNNAAVIPNFTIQKKQEEILITQVEPSLKTNRDYEFGLIYLDNYGRMSTIITCPTNTCRISNSVLNMPGANGNPKLKNYVELSIFHTPPYWATKYRLAIKQSAGEYYNIFPLSVIPKGAYSFYRLSPADKDKVNIGDFVVIKSTYEGITYSDKQYKVIDIVVVGPGTPDPEGLYIKISYLTTNAIAPVNTFSPTSILSVTGSASNLPSWNIIPSNPVDYSPIIFYPYSGLSFKTFDITYNMLINVPKDRRIFMSYAGINSLGQHCLNYRDFNSSQNINPTPVPFRQSITNASIPVPIYLTAYTSTPIGPLYGNVIISPSLAMTSGDSWRLNLYSKTSSAKTIAGNFVSKLSIVIPSNNPSTIYPGAEIYFGQLKEGNFTGTNFGNPSFTSPYMTYIAPTQYVDMQEWFWESGAYNTYAQTNGNNNTGYNNVFFRYGTGITQTQVQGTYVTIEQILPNTVGNLSTIASATIFMLVSTNLSLSSLSAYWYMTFELPAGMTGNYGGFSITYQKNFLCLETVPKISNNSVFHECTENLSIYEDAFGRKKHEGNLLASGTVQNQTNMLPAIVSLRQDNFSAFNNSFNCWAFPNGVESDRIKDEFNAPTMEWSPRVSVPIEDYGEQIVSEGLTYSGVYKQDSNVNNLNQFNISLGNFKYLDKSFGSVQKIKSRNTDLVVLQQDKVSKVLFGKNLLSDSTGGGQVASIPEVLGTQIAYQGEFGISNNPESFAQWDDNMFFTDSQRGAVLRLGNDGLFEISGNGMKAFFNTSFKSQPDTLKIGVFDPYYKRYILSETGFSKSQSLPSITVVNDPLDTLGATFPLGDDGSIIMSASGNIFP